MAKLVVSLGGELVSSLFLEPGVVEIGRGEGNQLHLEGEGVSKRHARITSVGSDDILEDLGSTNGTLVNGRPATRHILHNNDVVGIGDYQLKYISVKAVAGVDSDRTLYIPSLKGAVSSDAGTGVATAVATARQIAAAFPLARVMFMSGARLGEAVVLDRVLATFGRPGERLLVINRRPHGYFLTHVEGKGRAELNGRPIGDEPQALRAGDVIEILDEWLRFEPL
ncbi:MAG: FHA domain-containing protein [Pseudomonadota bacterium]